MSQGDKSAYTEKQKRQAQHIMDSELKNGKSKKVAQRIAWATVNKQDGGGLKRLTKSASKAKPKAKTSKANSTSKMSKTKVKLAKTKPKSKSPSKKKIASKSTKAKPKSKSNK